MTTSNITVAVASLADYSPIFWFVGFFVGVPAYSLILWWVGVSLRRNIRMRKELNTIRATLAPGNQLSEVWFQHHRKTGLALVALGTLSTVFPLLAGAWSYQAEYRAESVLMFTLCAGLPTICGLLGIVPIPGLSIED